jgi:hypothetical protein
MRRCRILRHDQSCNATETRHWFIRRISVASNKMNKLFKLDCYPQLYPKINNITLHVLHEMWFSTWRIKHPCSNCEKSTKYRCITCKTYVFNRTSCSMAVIDEEIEGWIPNVSFAYCNNYCPEISSISMIFSFIPCMFFRQWKITRHIILP